MSKFSVPPDKKRLNQKAFVGLQTVSGGTQHYNEDGCIIEYTPNVPQYGDVQLWCKKLGMTAAQFAKLVGKPKKKIIHWLKGDPEMFADLSREAEKKIIAAIAATQIGIPIVPMYEHGNIVECEIM